MSIIISHLCTHLFNAVFDRVFKQILMVVHQDLLIVSLCIFNEECNIFRLSIIVDDF